MTKLCNSRKILDACESNVEKFKVIRGLVNQLKEISIERGIKIIEIRKIYSIVLNCLKGKKQEVGVIGRRTYFVGTEGITVGSNYGNSENIKWHETLDEGLIIIKNNLRMFTKPLTKKKKRILTNFVGKAHLLKKQNCIQVVNTEVQEGKGKKFITNMKLEGFYLKCPEWLYRRIGLLSPRLEDLIVIEQLCSPIKKLLNKEIKLRQRELENIKKYIIDLDMKFSKFIKSVQTLKELNKNN